MPVLPPVPWLGWAMRVGETSEGLSPGGPLQSSSRDSLDQSSAAARDEGVRLKTGGFFYPDHKYTVYWKQKDCFFKETSLEHLSFRCCYDRSRPWIEDSALVGNLAWERGIGATLGDLQNWNQATENAGVEILPGPETSQTADTSRRVHR